MYLDPVLFGMRPAPPKAYATSSQKRAKNTAGLQHGNYKFDILACWVAGLMSEGLRVDEANHVNPRWGLRRFPSCSCRNCGSKKLHPRQYCPSHDFQPPSSISLRLPRSWSMFLATSTRFFIVRLKEPNVEMQHVQIRKSSPRQSWQQWIVHNFIIRLPRWRPRLLHDKGIA